MPTARNQTKPAEAPKAMNLPELAKKVDELFALDQVCKKTWIAHDDAKKAYQKLEDELIEAFGKSELEGALGKKAQISVKRESYPTVPAENWPQVYAYIKKNGAFELLQKRLSVTAVRERWDAGKAVPGIDKFIKVSLKLTPRKK